MSTSPLLPDLGRDQPPAFISASTCREWLSHLPLVNPAQAQATLIAQINLLNRFSIPAAERLRILETLREPVHFVTGESARKFAGRALPLAPAEQGVLEANLRLYRALATGYHHCLQACANREESASHPATAAERALTELASEQFDTYLASAELATAFWLRLYAIYALADGLGATHADVADKIFGQRTVSAQAVFAAIQLLQRASPHELTARQLAQVRGWIVRWCNLVPVSPTPPSGARLPPLIADLAGHTAAGLRHETGQEPRWLDVTAFAGKLKRRISGLQEGASPESLGLGEDCRQPACEQLLRHTYEHCCKGGISRAQPRRPTSGECRISAGLEAAFYYIGGAPFRQPMSGAELSKRQVDEIATFGRISTRELDAFSEQHGISAEAWQLADDSPAGLCLARAPGDTARIARGQVLALALAGEDAYRLGTARWIMLSDEGWLRLGLRILPGSAQAAVVRPAGSAHVRDKWHPGFLLPPVAAVKEQASIVIPAGWHRDGRVIDIWDTPRRSVRLGQLIERGFDYDRALYQPA